MFNYKMLALPLALGMSAPAAASASTWNVDGTHSTVGFKVRHMMISNVRGKFNKFEGTIELNDKDITKSKVDVTIFPASVDTDNEKRDKHLRGPDFFNAEKFPKMTFKSTKIEKKGDNLHVTGNLTMHGVTKPVTLEVQDLTAAIKDPWGMQRRGLSAEAKIDRTAFGLTWNDVLEAGGVAVGEEVTINLEVEIVQKK